MFGWSIMRQGLSLGFEAGDDLLGVHARLDDLQSDLAAHRLDLFGHVDDAEAAFADLLQQLVGSDLRTGLLGDGRQPSVFSSFRRSRKLSLCRWASSSCSTRWRSRFILATRIDDVALPIGRARNTRSRPKRWPLASFFSGGRFISASFRAWVYTKQCEIRGSQSHEIREKMLFSRRIVAVGDVSLEPSSRISPVSISGCARHLE